MNILDTIIAAKHQEVNLKRNVVSISCLSQSSLFERSTNSMTQLLKASNSGIIAEFKRRSPSKSVINNQARVEDVALGYKQAGVCGMSVLTDTAYFGGSTDDLLKARAAIGLPLLRKDFIIDEYQILEAKAYGADVILLIAAVLSRKEIEKFSQLAKKLHMEVLLEVHNLEELQRSMMSSIDMIGVNNRNLKTFEVSTDISKQLSAHIPNNFVKVSESGISNTTTIGNLKAYGYKGFLVGENFMKTENPGASAEMFIKALDV